MFLFHVHINGVIFNCTSKFLPLFQMINNGSVDIWSETVELPVFDDVKVTGLLIKIKASDESPEITELTVAACISEGMFKHF